MEQWKDDERRWWWRRPSAIREVQLILRHFLIKQLSIPPQLEFQNFFETKGVMMIWPICLFYNYPHIFALFIVSWKLDESTFYFPSIFSLSIWAHVGIFSLPGYYHSLIFMQSIKQFFHLLQKSHFQSIQFFLLVAVQIISPSPFFEPSEMFVH